MTAKLFLIGLLLAFLQPNDTLAQNISNTELNWSYGRSSPVYPSPTGAGTGKWTEAYSKARAMVSKMTNDEKATVVVGVSASNGCSGNSGAVDRIGFPGLCLQDGPSGVRGADFVSAFPSGVHIGASWNSTLANSVGTFMGAEFKKKGVNVALGPVVGPLGRIARGGRNWEGFSADPFLAGRLAGETVIGLQKSVIASVKHFIANEQEKDRNPALPVIASWSNSVSSNIDDRSMHELYLWPFQDAVKAGAGSVMCSYNRVNNSYACQNSKTLNGLLKTELGFQGFVVSDWYALHSGVASAAAGMDLVMPDASLWKGLNQAVQNGSLPEARLDDMAMRIIAAWYLLGQDAGSYPQKGVGMASSMTSPHKIVNAVDPASKPTVLQAAIEGHVLVKNVQNALPLKKPAMLSLFGYDATIPLVNNPSSLSLSRWASGFASTGISDAQLLLLMATGVTTPPGAATAGTIISGGGSGANTGLYISAPYDAFQQQAYEDSTYLHWDFQSSNPNINPASDACIVFINELAFESADRPGLADPGSDKLVSNVARSCKNTMVVIHNAGIRLVDNWIDNPNITAVIYAHLPGQDSGRALVEIMYGRQSPSGRLPYTVAKKENDYGDLLAPSQSNTGTDPQSNFKEGLEIDYRAFIAKNITPRYEFGYGLTYTKFDYSSMAVALFSSVIANISMTYLPPPSPIESGGMTSLFETIASADCRITNSGQVSAAEVAQLYLGIPNAPLKQLRGFRKKILQPGTTENFHFDLTRRDMSIWSTVDQNWVLQKGDYKIYIGASVSDIRLRGNLTINN
ncbi:beta-glucosidase [Tothia fuscella]|uniref:beta-glucosidase n=1 Tax=Tothia fuscella TaxID=1048955 RepID=A0A9P4TWS4_9PEZI|nr:beta-glucosidase [Tothia fuscella]